MVIFSELFIQNLIWSYDDYGDGDGNGDDNDDDGVAVIIHRIFYAIFLSIINFIFVFKHLVNGKIEVDRSVDSHHFACN